MQSYKAAPIRNWTNGTEGLDFQLNLTLCTLLKLQKFKLVSFKLYSDYIPAGKFDDIVLIYEDEINKERSCLLQARHVIDELKTISSNEFTSGDKFNLAKYFDSFKKIIKEEQFKDNLEHLILFTNLNISKSLLPYVEEVQTLLPIWNCETVEGNEKKPQFYKLNSKFIDEYQYFHLRELSNVIIEYCIKDIELKHKNNNFNHCHIILAREVFNVQEKCFRKEFIERKHLLPETKKFRDIFEEEIQKRSKVDKNFIVVDTPKWLQNKKFKFSEKFGKSSSRSWGADSWPIPIKDDEKELFKIFCSYLLLALNQPNDGELEECLTNQCSEYFSRSLVYMAKGELKFQIRQWYKDRERTPLTWQFLPNAIKYIKDNEGEVVAAYNSDSEITELCNQKIELKFLSLMSDIEIFLKAEEKRFLLIITQNPDLSLIKTVSCLSKFNNLYLCTTKSKLSNSRNVFLKSMFYNLLVWRQIASSKNDIKLFVDQFNDLVAHIPERGKKVIVIINESEKVFATELKAAENWIQWNYDVTQFGHLTEVTRLKLMETNVSFQGYEMQFNQMLGVDFRLNQVAHDSWADLLSSGNIQIGQEINLSKAYNNDYYFQRTIVMTSSNTEEEQSLNEKEFIEHALLQDLDPSLKRSTDNISNFNSHKIFVLSDPAGMGKTLVSSSLANEIKRTHPHMWVARLVAMECVSQLDEFNESNTSDASHNDFFTSKLLKLSSPLEIFVFGQYLENEKSENKLVVIFDGYDEINEKCQRVITNLLLYLSQKPNVGFILVTTRPQCQQDLEEQFQRKACFLKPFDEQNKIEFLVRYWTSRGMEEPNYRLTEYAKRTINCISCCITKDESQLTSIPLQMRMIAEIFERYAHSYTQNVDVFSTMSLCLFDLYEKFMQINEDICMNEKLKDAGLAFNTKMLKSVQQHQNRFAREIIFERLDVFKVEASELETTTQFGIIQQNQKGDFYFIHRTFAEFLTAKYLLEEFIEKDSVPVAEKIQNGLLIEQIKKSSLYGVRKFINSRLNSAKLADECKRSDDKRAIQNLLGDKCSAIIVTSAEEEIHEFIKLTIEVNSWLRPNQIYSKLTDSLWRVADNSEYLTVILDYMLDKWLPTKDIILLKTIDFLIRKILVNENENQVNKRELTRSTIDFQNKLERAGVLTEEELRNILSTARDDVVNRSMYWNWYPIEYYKHLHSNHRNLFYDFLNDNRTLLHTIMKRTDRDDLTDFLLLIQSDKEMNANWVFDNLIEDKFVEFGNLEDTHFELYLCILLFVVGQFHSERKEKFRDYLEEVIHLLYRQCDLSWKGLFTKFLMGYETIIPMKEIILKYRNTKTTEDLEYCALWGQTNKLKDILKFGDIETATVERFQLGDEAEDLQSTRRRILVSTRKRQGEEEFLQWIGQQNWRGRTILQHALSEEDNLNIEIISTWITTQEIFEKIMRMDYDTAYYASENVLFLNFVNERFPQYRMTFLEINKNDFISSLTSRQEILRMIENDESMSQIEFVQILKLQTDLSGFEGCTILHYILADDDLHILKKWLNLMKKLALNTETITQLMCIDDKNRKSPLDYIKHDSNYDRRQKKKEICDAFFVEHKLLELKKEIENSEYPSDNEENSGGNRGGSSGGVSEDDSENGNESSRLMDRIPNQIESKCCCVIL